MFAPGQSVGPYRLVSLLGQGGSGQVWEATLHGAHGFRKAVALKLLPGGPDDLRRAARIREARLGALLHHPNWVTTYDLGERGDTLFIAMELVHGPACASFVTGLGGLPPRVVLDLGVQAAAALEHIHRLVSDATPHGLVHGDVKPSNLLLDRTTGLLKITDLGISSALGEEAAASGTPGYVAPERVKRLPFDGRSDLFGLGATLCALATGVRPFGTGVAAMAAAFHVEAVLEKGSVLGRVDAAVPGLGEIVRRCLRAEPSDRWPSAAELGEALGLLATTTYGGEPGLIEWMDALPPEPSNPGADDDGGTDDDTRPAHAVFVGRGAEVADLCDRLRRGERLVTVVGLGGAGKTRIAQQVALTVRDAFPGGGWFVDLTEARHREARAVRG
ncbi:MAG: serine/threonine-protein kinase, partial [Myxococcota bacterium]